MKTGRPKKEINLLNVESAASESKTVGEIADKLGVHRNSIYRRLATDDLFKAAYLQGLSKKRDSINIDSKTDTEYELKITVSGADLAILREEAKADGKTLEQVIKEAIEVNIDCYLDFKEFNQSRTSKPEITHQNFEIKLRSGADLRLSASYPKSAYFPQTDKTLANNLVKMMKNYEAKYKTKK